VNLCFKLSLHVLSELNFCLSVNAWFEVEKLEKVCCKSERLVGAQ